MSDCLTNESFPDRHLFKTEQLLKQLEHLLPNSKKGMFLPRKRLMRFSP